MFNISAAGRLSTLALAAIAIAAPASAATVLMGGPTGQSTSIVRSADDISFDISAHIFSVAPGALTNTSQFTGTGFVSVTAPGIGVAGGASNPQVDTNQVKHREGLLLTANKKVGITALKLSYIDSNDTLQIFGVGADGSLTSLGFDGTIRTGLGGAATVVNSSANDGTSVLTFLAPLAAYQSYLFTTRVGGDVNYGGQLGQGYRIDSITASGAVPEPATWAMFIAGFGLVGAAVRRRKAVHA
jgi:hypothetical protein